MPMLLHWTLKICLLLAIVSIVSAQNPTITFTYTGVPITRQTSPYVLSIQISFGNQNPSQVYGLYAVGYTSPTDFLNWTLVSNPTNASTVQLATTFATPLPTGLPINATLQTYYYANNSLIGTYVSSPIVVGDRVSTDASCPNIWDPVGLYEAMPPAPNATITFNTTTQTFNFNVSAAYLLQEWTWVIDLAPFTNNYQNGYLGLAVTNCENRNVSEIANRNFAELFNAAPASNANSGGGPALNDKNFLSYDFNNTGWQVSSPSCSQIAFYRSFSFSQIRSCQQYNNASSITITTDSNGITYSGILYVTAVTPISSLSPNQNFEYVVFKFPWQFSFSVTSMSIGTAVDTPLLSYVIDQVSLVGSGNLYIEMTTNTLDSSYTLSYLSVAAPPGITDLGLLSVNNASSPIQVWQFETASDDNNYTGNYTFSFNRSQISTGNNPQVVTVFVDIQMSVNSLQTGPNTTFTTAIQFYGNSSFIAGQQKSNFTQLDTVYVLTSINLANPADINTFDISTRNVWLCYTTNNVAPVYDGVTNFGCEVETATVRPIAQIISNGAQSSGPLASQFVINFYDPITSNPSLGSSSAGFSFTAAPLVAVRGYGSFFVQVQSSISSASKKRDVMFISEVAQQPLALGTSLGGANIVAASPPTTPSASVPTPTSTPSTVHYSLGNVHCVSLGLLNIFILIVAFLF
jgi:hypothetical protein